MRVKLETRALAEFLGLGASAGRALLFEQSAAAAVSLGGLEKRKALL